MASVFFSIPLGDAVHPLAADSLFAVCLRAGERNYNRISCGRGRTDQNRNIIVDTFLKYSEDPNDVLVMLDADHTYPQSVVQELAAVQCGVVGALAYKRGDNHHPLFFVRQKDGSYVTPIEWPKYNVIECDFVSTSAIAIKHWVFDKLAEAGFERPYFRYTYGGDGPVYPAEDTYFAEICQAAGIPHNVDTGLVIPHISDKTIDGKDFEAWLIAHPEKITEMEVEGEDEQSVERSLAGNNSRTGAADSIPGSETSGNDGNGNLSTAGIRNLKNRLDRWRG